MKKALTIALTAVALLSAADAHAQTKQAPPAAGQPKSIKLPAMKKLTLPNGMKVTLVPFGAIPKTDVQLVVRVGNVDEAANEVWLGDLMADLMREGTTTRTAAVLNKAAAEIGGSVNANLGLDELTVSSSALAENADVAVRLVADVALHPRFPESELTRIRQARLRSLALQKSQPQILAIEKFHAVLYPDHPYGRFFPTEAQLQGYTLQQIKDFYGKNMKAARAHLYVAGQFNSAQLEKTIREQFGSWESGTPVMPTPPKNESKRAIYIVDRPGAVQSSLYIGGPTIDNSNPDYVALVVTDALLGGAFASRITKNIREDKGYTYSPGSTVSTRYRNAYWAETADVTTNVTGPSLKEIIAEINKLQAEPPAAKELKGIQDYLAGVFTLQNASRGGIIGLLRRTNLHGLPETDITDYVKKVYAVTPADVQRVAQKYLDDDNMVIVIVGDKKAIEEQVKPFGPIMP